MKYLFALLLCVIVSMAQAQDSIKTLHGFWGIKFGSNKAECIKILLKKGAILDKKNSDKEYLRFKNIEFGGFKADLLSLVFYKDKMNTAILYFSASSKEGTEDLYDEIRMNVNKKYFSPQSVFKYFKSPYDTNEYRTEKIVEAIEADKAIIASYWEFSNGTENCDMISLKIHSDFTIALGYQSGKMMKAKEADMENQSSKDF